MPPQRFTPIKKARLEFTKPELTATLDAVAAARETAANEGDTETMKALSRVLRRLGMECQRIGAGRIR